jgi:hypothetical protein
MSHIARSLVNGTQDPRPWPRPGGLGVGVSYPHLSEIWYWTASATCSIAISSTPARSAIVRPTRRHRRPRAERERLHSLLQNGGRCEIESAERVEFGQTHVRVSPHPGKATEPSPLDRARIPHALTDGGGVIPERSRRIAAFRSPR